MSEIPKEFVGRWRIKKMEVWGNDVIDMVEPAHFTFWESGKGHFIFVAVQGGMDARFEDRKLVWSWIGEDDRRPTAGRGWARLTRAGKLKGRIYLHDGDDSSFEAARED